MLSVVLFFAATVLFWAPTSAFPSPQGLLNCGSASGAAQTLCMGLPIIGDALTFNRNGPDASFGDADSSHLRGGPLISAIDALT